MNKRKVVLVSLPSGMFGNGGKTWLSIDLAPTRALLEARGFAVEDARIDQSWELDLAPDDIVVYSSCEASEVREYMKDAFYFLRKRCILLPDYEFLLAYENKGFQELKKRSLGIGNLPGDYHYDLDGHERAAPYVFKTIGGAGSSGVHLVQTPKDGDRLRDKYFSVDLKRRVLLQQRKRVLTAEQFDAYRYRHKGFRRYIAQAFVPRADHDYKVLVFGERFFGLKRHVRKNDFRASGSGNFDFSARLPEAVLSFAKGIAERLDAPQLSLDIVASPEGCHLIEYQGLNFGPITLTRSKGFYSQAADGTWDWTAGSSDLAECFAHSIGVYFDHHGIRAKKLADE